ncbi:MAG: ABC transporter ATP-binding protein [Oscillospiraceae bacterium]|nr:ABC transporter ATP-binding protein [Oscillospiraceae bacterium]
MPTIQLENITKIFNRGQENEVTAIALDSLTIRDGEFISVMGSSGAGKSTLMHILGCLDSPTAGRYLLNGRQIKFSNGRLVASLRNRLFGFIFQEYGLITQQTVLENVEIPLLFSKSTFKYRKRRCMDVLDALSIGEQAKKKCSQLSGGQKQRVAIARALVNNPELLLADEPTGALDSATARDILEVFRELNAQGKTVIIVTHDPTVAEICTRHITISDGVITEDS